MGETVDIRRVFRFAPGRFLVLRADRDFTIVAASDDYLQASFTDTSIVGRSLFHLFADNPRLDGADRVQDLRASLSRVVSTCRTDVMAAQRFDVRRPQVRGGGHEEHHWLPVHAPVLGDDGTVEYIIHRVDEVSATADRDAVGILSSITEGFFTLDRQWRFDYVNREAHRILDREPGDLAGKVLWEAYPGLEGTVFEQSYLRTMTLREKTSFTAFYAGHDRWYEVTTFPAAVGISVYFRDVTEQKNLHAQRDALMAESERQRRIFETALDSTPDFVYVFDLEHRAIYANAALRKTWGVDDVRGKRWMDLGYEQWHADLHDRELDQVIATRSPIQGEIPFTGTNGQRIYDYIFAPVLGVDGQVVAVAGTTRDVTDRNSMVSRMLESQRLEAIGTLAGGVAHDFNNMLAAILGNAALAQQEMDPNSAAMDRVRLIHRAAERARSLVRQILTFSRRTPRFEACQSLQPLVDEAIAFLRSTLPASANLQSRASPAPLWAWVDGPQLQQLVVNLCTNAWQALGDESGEIDVSLEQVTLTETQASPLHLAAGDHACLTVADTGHGMDEAVRSRMFEPFFTTKPVGQGTGLGLAVVRSVVKESGGSVRVDSEPGRGTRISVYLPLAPEPSAGGVAEPGEATATVNPPGARILYVDDDEVVSLTAAALLSKSGFAVSCAPDGLAALAAMREMPGGFAAVVTDFNMAGMSGLAVAEAVQRVAPGTPVIVTSGLITDELRLAAHSLGLADVVAKEEMLERLAGAVQRAIRAR